MNITLIGGDNASSCRIIFQGSMTFKFSRTIEQQITDTMSRYQRVDIDLSGVNEIDLSGIHLISVMQSMSGNKFNIIATSPVVEQASRRLLASPHRGCSLGRVARPAIHA